MVNKMDVIIDSDNSDGLENEKPRSKRRLGVDIGRGRIWEESEIVKKERLRLNVWLDSDKYAELKRLAELEEMTVSDLIRSLVDGLLGYE